ncbi:Gx transporter family protein [Streptococcus sp. X16XC17]|uniref:Gx transporter family protein n=2 Tax=unclassified Streptococcus TaxID=2608887 RepID=UPI00103BECD9|nr:Gx transporter family protein [Streptococcus sp. X16XC17]TCD46235.1 Gx transporter family protein [Streptococcus sp. X16XC17]
MSKHYQKMTFITMLAAQAIVISVMERAIPSPFTFAPGAKLGLGNLVTIIAIFTLPPRDNMKVIGLRLFVSTFLSGTFSTFLYSLSGTVFSYLVMTTMKLLGSKRVSIIGISTLGGIMHNMGQLLVFAFIAQSWMVLNYLPILAFSGILSGFLVGVTGNYLLKKIQVLHVYHKEMLTDWGVNDDG